MAKIKKVPDPLTPVNLVYVHSVLPKIKIVFNDGSQIVAKNDPIFGSYYAYNCTNVHVEDIKLIINCLTEVTNQLNSSNNG